MNQQSTAAQRPESAEERIIEATFRVVARETISGTRIPLIAREVGMSQGIIHYHFETKEQLLLRLHDWLLAAFGEFRGVTTGWSAGELLERDGLRAMIEYQRVLIGPERNMLRVFYDYWVQAATGTGALADAIREHFKMYRGLLRAIVFDQQGSASGDFADIAPALFLSLLEGAALQLIVDDEAFDADVYFAALERLAAMFSGT